MSKKDFPQKFLDRLESIVPSDRIEHVLRGFIKPDLLCVRVNTLKTTVDECLEYFDKRNIAYESCQNLTNAYILRGVLSTHLQSSELIESGKIYIQGLSSQLPVQILNPERTDRVLDLCAAPGSKTSQMAAMMNNEGQIIAVEAIKKRFYRLKSVLNLTGVSNTQIKLMDGRRYQSNDLFDKVLVDVPCSSEGRFRTNIPKTYLYWSERKIKEMVRKQRGLILNASRLLKPGGTLIYSTCTFAPEENEGIIDWLIRKTKESLKVEEILFDGIETYPAVRLWKKREYSDQVRHCLRILPSELMEGFFIAKIVKGS